jgi:hypothetical protein
MNFVRHQENRELCLLLVIQSEEYKCAKPVRLSGYANLHNEELHNLCASLNIIRAVKSRTMRWAGHVARVGERRNAYKILVGSLKGRGLSGDHGVDKRKILELILGKQAGKAWTGFI